MKVYFDMVGCRLNQAEIEKMSLEFRQAGHEIVGQAENADLVVVNTCSVTTQAASDSRQKIRRYGQGEGKEVVVTGCWSTIEPAAASGIKNVIKVVPNQEKDHLVRQVLQQKNIPLQDLFESEPLERGHLPGLRQRTRAFIKVQDGCDNRCTFCITRIARGQGVSRPAKEVISEINAAAEGGSNEVVLTGVHLGSWGQDLPSRSHLGDLLKLILANTSIPRIRLSSLEPWDLDGEFFTLWENKRLCQHLHLPLQAGSDATLRRMLRNTNTANFRSLVQQARQTIPNLSITTDLIAGFPGESETEFTETLAFVEEMAFSGGHVFTYSERAGTPAARIRDQVPHHIRKERNGALQKVIKKSANDFVISQIGQVGQVLWEASQVRTEKGWRMSGLTSNYIRVFTHTPQHLWNQIDQVRLCHHIEDGAEGVILPQEGVN